MIKWTTVHFKKAFIKKFKRGFVIKIKNIIFQ